VKPLNNKLLQIAMVVKGCDAAVKTWQVTTVSVPGISTLKLIVEIYDLVSDHKMA
jgi:hypothetical protein